MAASEPTILSTPQTAGTRGMARRLAYEAGAQRSGYSSSGLVGGAAFGGLICTITSNFQEQARKEQAGLKRYAAAMAKKPEVEKHEGAPTFCCVWCWEELAEFGSKACGHVFGCASCVQKAPGPPRCPMCRADTDGFVKAKVLYDLGKKVFTSGIDGPPSPPEVHVIFTDQTASGKAKSKRFADVIDLYTEVAVRKAFEEDAAASPRAFTCVTDVATSNPSLFWSVVLLDEAERNVDRAFARAGMGAVAAAAPPRPPPPPPPPPTVEPTPEPKAKGKAKAAATAAPKPRSKLTYPKAVVQVVKAHGLLSRAALSKEVKGLGLDKDSQLKAALKALVTQGGLELDGASYKLGTVVRAGLKAGEAEVYEAALERAAGAREDKAVEKEAGRLRADAQAIRNIKAACKR